MEKFSNIIFTEPRFNQQPSAWIEHIPFAFFLIEKLRPKMFVELGTQFGNSYFAFCQAINQLKLTTKAYGVDIWISNDKNDTSGHKIFNHANAINANHFSHFSNLLLMTFDEALQYFNAGEIDLLHIDGMHDYASVKHDFESWLPKMSDVGVIIFHDSNVRENNFGVWKLMDEIKDEFTSFQFSFGYGLGVVCTGKKVQEEFLRFAKDAQTDEFTHQLFNALGSRWRLKNKLETVENRTGETIRQLTDRIHQLENQVAAKEAEIENLKNRPVSPSSQILQYNQARPSIWLWFRNKISTWVALRTMRKSGLFDGGYYLRHNPDVKASRLNPTRHYLLYGGFEGRNPSEKFDSAFYLDQYPDVKGSGINPLLHYIRFGKDEKRKTYFEKLKNVFPNESGIMGNTYNNRWKYKMSFLNGAENNGIKVNYFDQSIKANYSYGNAIAHWEKEIQDFWNLYIDRYYEFFILTKKLKKGHVLDVGAEFYNKYIKEVIALGQELTIVDLKTKDHPDIEIIKDLDHYYKFDMTKDDYRNYPGLSEKFDTVLSFGVLSYYNITPEMCTKYLDNLDGFLKPDGLAIIKVDKTTILKHADFPTFQELHAMIGSKFLIREVDLLTDDDMEFVIYYCGKNEAE